MPQGMLASGPAGTNTMSSSPSKGRSGAMISAVSVCAWCLIDSLITLSSRVGSRRPASVSRSAFSLLAASAAASKSPSGTSRAEPRRTTTATISLVRARMPTRV